MIAVISDIHGNFPALRAVTAEIDRFGCTQIVSLGDVAGYYCQVNECVALLREKDVVNLLGNHDYYLLENQPCPRSNSANLLLDYQRRIVTAESRDWLRQSPRTFELGQASFVHGGWRDFLDEYMDVVNDAYFAGLQARFFFSGHTHVQSLVPLTGRVYCNPGSVGQPRDGQPEAAFALFDGTQVTLHRVAYDIDEIAAAMEACGFGRYFYAGLYTGQRIGAR